MIEGVVVAPRERGSVSHVVRAEAEGAGGGEEGEKRLTRKEWNASATFSVGCCKRILAGVSDKYVRSVGVGPGRVGAAKLAVIKVDPSKTCSKVDEELGSGPVGRKVYEPTLSAFGHQAVGYWTRSFSRTPTWVPAIVSRK